MFDYIPNKKKKPKIIGYGEDFLTFWAISNKLELILKKLKDNTEPNDCIIFYRPSFGRAGGKDSAQFGEFDSIIISSDIAYLVESKWDGSNMPDNILKLDEVQIERHNILKGYHDHWKGEDWNEFIQNNAKSFYRKFHKPIAPANSLLSRNLQTILTEIKGKKLRNILLFFYKDEIPKIESNFKKIKLQYTPKYGNFIKF